jgi:hypothetical protein
MAVARQLRENIFGEFIKASVRFCYEIEYFSKKIYIKKCPVKLSIKVASSDLCIVVYETFLEVLQ